jgi:hypothetical protein
MHINSDITFGHSRVQNNEAKENKGYPYTFSKKSTMIIPKAGVLMVKIREGYYRSRRYEISDRYYFDNGRADL